MTAGNRRVRFIAAQDGAITAANFTTEACAVPEPRAGELLLRTRWISIDPYILWGLHRDDVVVTDAQILRGRVVGEVMVSAHADFSPGDWVLAPAPWQRYSLCDATAARVIERDIDAAAHLGAAGHSGVTAWIGLHHVARIAPGETILVSAATGAVGSTVGQLAAMHGCRVIGIAGGTEKCTQAVARFGYSVCIDHRLPDLADRLAAVGGGIDVLFENVGGALFDAALPSMRDHGRIVLCGLASHYTGSPPAMPHFDYLLRRSLSLQAFRIQDLPELQVEARRQLLPLVGDGRLRCEATVFQGLENCGNALLSLESGSHFGKALVRVG